MKVDGLIFIYNAQSGVFHSLIDYFHKVLSPSTYECSLCSLTYNNYGRLRVWKQFIQSLNIPVTFKYSDHLSEIGIDKQTKLPVVINTDLSLVASAEEINQCKTISALIKMIRKKI
tara:strand:+ start:192 stop:539 length:348 start_codon:yes stop_codon:yes gene_type:complete